MESSRIEKYMGAKPGRKTERRRKRGRSKGAEMKEQLNPVSGLRIPEGAPNPLGLQPRAGKQGMDE